MNIKSLGLEELSHSEKKKVNGGWWWIIPVGIAVAASFAFPSKVYLTYEIGLCQQNGRHRFCFN